MTRVQPESRVYPRVCGGTDDLDDVQGLNWKGLSPRVRGNPAASRAFQAIGRVYPRVCGGTEPPSGQFETYARQS